MLEEHRRRHEAGEKAYNFSAMCKDLTAWRGYADALRGLNAQSLQVTAKRVALSFDAFFRRLKSGDEPGYPRFKSFRRFPGWGYKTYGDGWKLLQSDGKHGKVRLSGIGEIRIRGKGRFTGTPKAAEVIHKAGKWYLSVTYDVAETMVARQRGSEAAAFDRTLRARKPRRSGRGKGRGKGWTLIRRRLRIPACRHRKRTVLERAKPSARLRPGSTPTAYGVIAFAWRGRRASPPPSR